MLVQQIRILSTQQGLNQVHLRKNRRWSKLSTQSTDKKKLLEYDSLPVRSRPYSRTKIEKEQKETPAKVTTEQNCERKIEGAELGLNTTVLPQKKKHEAWPMLQDEQVGQQAHISLFCSRLWCNKIQGGVHPRKSQPLLPKTYIHAPLSQRSVTFSKTGQSVMGSIAINSHLRNIYLRYSILHWPFIRMIDSLPQEPIFIFHWKLIEVFIHYSRVRCNVWDVSICTYALLVYKLALKMNLYPDKVTLERTECKGTPGSYHKITLNSEIGATFPFLQGSEVGVTCQNW